MLYRGGSTEQTAIGRPYDQPESKSRLLVVERVAVIFVLLSTTYAHLPLIPIPGFLQNESTLLASAQVTRYLGYFTAILLILAFYKTVWRAAKRVPWVLLVIGWIACSPLWSISPMLSLESSFTLILFSLFGLLVSERYDLRDVMQMAVAALFIIVFISYLLVLSPSLSRIDGDGDWKGAFSHKNSLGQKMLITVLISLLLFMFQTARKAMYLAIAALAFFLLIQSDSKTSLIVLIVALASLPVFIFAASKPTIFTFLATIFLIGIPFGLISQADIASTIFGVFGRDATLTGRTDIWNEAIERAAERPWFGYGYNAFWQGADGPSADFFFGSPAIGLVYRPPNSHNGYLDLWLAVGLVGLFVFVVAMIKAFIVSLKALKSQRSVGSLFAVVYLVMFNSYNIVESALVQYDLLWVLFVVVAAASARQSSTATLKQGFANVETANATRVTSGGHMV